MNPSEPQPSGVVRFDTDDVFWQDWWRNWWLYGTVYAINHPEPRIVPAETLTVHEGPCEAQGIPPSEARLRAALLLLHEWREASLNDDASALGTLTDATTDFIERTAATPSGGIPLIDVELLQGAVEVAFEKGREWEPDPIHSFMNNPIWPYDKFTRILAAEYTRLSESSPAEEGDE